MMKMESETEAWTSDELDYASIVRRQIAKTADALSRAVGREDSVRGWHSVRTLSGLLDPYKPEGFQEGLDEADKPFKEAREKAKLLNDVNKRGWEMAHIRMERSHVILRRLLGLAKGVGILLQEDLIEGERKG